MVEQLPDSRKTSSAILSTAEKEPRQSFIEELIIQRQALGFCFIPGSVLSGRDHPRMSYVSQRGCTSTLKRFIRTWRNNGYLHARTDAQTHMHKHPGNFTRRTRESEDDFRTPRSQLTIARIDSSQDESSDEHWVLLGRH